MRTQYPESLACYGARARGVAAARRAVHWPPGMRGKPGHAGNIATARLIVHKYTLCCKRCGTLVDMPCDMRSAKVEATLREHRPRRVLQAVGFRPGAASFAPGDGCASASCSSQLCASECAASVRASVS